MMRGIIIDDEKLSIVANKNVLEATGNIEIVRVYDDSVQALGEIADIQPDVCFLDIKMPGANGFQVAKQIKAIFQQVDIVFITAYQEFALDAFEAHVFDYMLKPLHPDRVAQFANRWERHQLRVQGIHTEPVRDAESLQLDPQICVLGGLKLRTPQGDNLFIKWRTAKTEELFSYFLIHPNSPISRDKILDALWPEQIGLEGNAILHTTIYRLKKALKDTIFEDAITYSDASYLFRMNLQSCDLYLLEKELRQLLPADERSAQRLNLVLDLFKGSVFEERMYEWSFGVREVVLQMFTRASHELANYYARNYDIANVERCYLRVLRYSAFDEETSELLLKSYAQRGERAAFLRHYKIFKTMLDRTYGLEPKQSIQALYEQVKSI